MNELGLRPPGFVPRGREPGRSFDRLGRSQPRRMDAFLFAKAIPGLIDQFNREVPPAFFTQIDAETVEVACPCKATPQVALNRIGGCDSCERFFIYTGARVLVACSPAGEAQPVLDPEPVDVPPDPPVA